MVLVKEIQLDLPVVVQKDETLVLTVEFSLETLMVANLELKWVHLKEPSLASTTAKMLGFHWRKKMEASLVLSMGKKKD